tara:strand:- start:3845 stop:4258 length:414 start_codon:yes stop_codon:yes gene_type:complete
MPKIEVSNGEIIDKFTILLIKKDKIKDASKLKHIENELKVFLNILNSESGQDGVDKLKNVPDTLINDLKEINSKLWNIEDQIRLKEQDKDFGEQFIKLSRSIYTLNDKRFRIKNKINEVTKSALREQKDHKTCEGTI